MTKQRRYQYWLDTLSGLTVALALVPEAIAFSFVAHVDPRVGLYAAIIMGLVTALLGGRPGMISGATGAVAVIFAPLVISQTQQQGMAVALSYLFLAVVIMGVFQLIFGLLRWGKFIRLIPQSVMFGFVNGLAIVIFKSQLTQFYIQTHEGLQIMPLRPLLIMLGLVALTMAIIYGLPKITKRLPATLTAILAVSGVSVYLQSLGYDSRTVLDFVQTMDPTQTTIAVGLPQFQLPILTLDAVMTVLPYSFLAASVGLIESLMTLVLVDELTGTRGRGNKESLAQGIANVLNGFLGGMGGCAMIGQSMINVRAGGRGRWSGVVAAGSLLIFLIMGARWIERIPLAALVGVMVMVSIATFEWSSFRIIKKIPKSDVAVIVIVSVTTVLVDLAVAVFVGVIISALVFAWEQGKRIAATESTHDTAYKVYTLNGGLFFGSATAFKALFDVDNDPDHVAIDFRHARVYDHSGLEAIHVVAQRYAQVNKNLHILNVSPECQSLLDRADNIVEVQVLESLNHWRIAEDRLA
jgi:SulP family sulfate permease